MTEQAKMSTPIELNNLVERVGLEAAIAAVRGWIGRQDAERFLAAEAARAAPAGILPPVWRREPPAPGTEDEGLAAASSCGLAPSVSGNPCPCEANRGDDCDCWEDRFREAEDGGGLAAASSCGLATESSAEPRAEDCDLHWTQAQSAAGGGAMLGPTHNGRGYSTMSPPCNGCPIGQREREAGIWHSGFGNERNVFYQGATGPMQPLYPVGGPAPLAGWRGTLTATPTGGVAPTSSEWHSGGAALCPTPSGAALVPTASGTGANGNTGPLPELAPVPPRNALVRLQTVMLDCLRDAENAPSKWAIDNLVNAMESFRAAGGDGDNYRYCQERLAELDR